MRVKVNKNTILKSCQFIIKIYRRMTSFNFDAEFCSSKDKEVTIYCCWDQARPNNNCSQCFVHKLDHEILENLWQRVSMPTWSATIRTFPKTSRSPVSTRKRIITQLFRNLYTVRAFFFYLFKLKSIFAFEWKQRVVLRSGSYNFLPRVFVSKGSVQDCTVCVTRCVPSRIQRPEYAQKLFPSI